MGQPVWRDGGQRSACSFNVARSITHQPGGRIAVSIIPLWNNGCCPVSDPSDCSLGFPHGSMFPNSLPRALSWGRENIMPTYRAYLIDADNRVSSYRPIEAATDAAALKAARQFVDGCDVEVWHLDRKIGRLGRAGK